MPRPPVPVPSDWLRQRIIDRAAQLGLSARGVYAIADDREEGQVSYNSVHRYLTRRADLTGAKIQILLDALGLDVRDGERETPVWQGRKPARNQRPNQRRKSTDSIDAG